MKALAWGLVAAWLAQAGFALWCLATFLRLRAQVRPQPAEEPPVCVLVPVRGDPGGLPAALAAQDWPRWHVVFALEDATDPAFAVLSAFCAEDPARRELVLAGATGARTQKLHNLLAALPRLRPEDRVLVTLDADTVPPPDMLRRLLRPVLAGGADIASGYRWLLPGRGLGGRLAALADQAIASLPQPKRLKLVWGGATAIRVDVLPRLDLPQLWQHAVTDDLTLCRAVRRSGLVLHTPPDVRLPSPVEWTLPQGLRFARRQFRLVWLLARPQWALALAGFALPVAGCAAACGLGAWWVLAVALGLQQLRLWLRARLHGPQPAPWLAPLAMPFALAGLLASPGRSLLWAGRCYVLSPAGAVLAPPRLCTATRRAV